MLLERNGAPSPAAQPAAVPALAVLASIEEPELIERIPAHRRERGDEEAPTASLGARAPPQAALF